MGSGEMGLNAANMNQQARENFTNVYGNAMNMSNQGAEAQAAGIMGAGNAWQQALGGISGNAQFAELMNMFGGGGGSSTAAISPSVLSALPYGAPSGDAAYGLGSSTSGGGFGIG